MLEQLTNSRTATERANLLQLTMEFKSICSHGRILWLGTPQSTDSIYNALPSRGVDIRIWPARYPTHEQRGYYGGNLAPLLLERMEKDPSLATGGGLTGDQGKPTDPELFGEENLQSKEAGQEAYFQLQQMLNTSAMDRLRYPLKTTNIIMAGTILDASKKLSAPLVVLRSTDPKDFIKKAVGTFQFNLAGVHSQSKDIARMQSIVGYVDPASGGQNGDETGYAVVGLLNSTLYLLSVGGVPGGFTPELLNRLSEKICQFEVDALIVEKNLGHGAVKAVLAPVFQQVYTKKYGKPCRVDDELVTGQKEPRIIKTLEPIMGRGSLVVTPDCVEEDEITLSIHSPAKRQSYSFFYQLAKITNDRRSLEHDDRLDAVSGACRFFTPRLALDQTKALEEEARKQAAELFRFTLGGKPRYGDTSNNLINSRFRR